MPQIYEIKYKPFENNNLGYPWLYSGSDYYDNENYLGSASSKALCPWDESLTIAQWWKKETKKHPELFEKNILVKCSNEVTRIELQSLESAIQKAEDHRNNPKYFNRTNKHFNSEGGGSVLKGLSYDEIHGLDKSRSLKENKSKAQMDVRKQKFWSSAGGTPLKGTTYEETMGFDKAKQVKENKRKTTLAAMERGEIGFDVNKQIAEGKHPSQIKKQCEHCGKIVDSANYQRWHGVKCKNANI